MVAARKKSLEKMFLQDKPTKLLLSLKGNNPKYASILAKDTDCTYSHCVRILQQMQQCRLVNFEKKGRIKLVKLSSLGEDVAFALENLSRTLNKT